MTATNWLSGRLVRVMAGLLMVGGLALCHSLQRLTGQDATAPLFLLVVAVCAALVLLTRGLGERVGLVLGLITGLVAAAGLVRQYPTPPGNLLAFVAIATGVVGFLGHLAGGWRGFGLTGEGSPRRSLNRSGSSAAGDSGRGAWLSHRNRSGADKYSEEHRPALLAVDVLGALAADFCEWIESESGKQCCTDPVDWSGFDQFLRSTLREQLGAVGVRVLQVSADAERLEPLTRHAGAPDQWPSTRLGLVGHVVTSGRVYVAGDPGQGDFIAELAQVDADPLPEGKQPATTTPVAAGPYEPRGCSWLLPLRTDKRTVGLIAVRRVDKPSCRGPAMANAVRNQLQLFWAHVTGLQVLSRHLHTDSPSGMPNRTELLGRLHEVVHAVVRDGEPVMILALAIEGLRGLDDSGRWFQRDTVVQRLGQVLRSKVRSDDLLGRFSDDRFVIVLRRLDSALGTLVAEKLMETVRTSVLDPLEDQTAGIVNAGEAGVRLRLRAGLAGTGLPAAGRPTRSFATCGDLSAPEEEPEPEVELPDGQALLERALGLLEYARQQRIDVATDLMRGLPEHLARRGGGAAEHDTQPAAGSSSPVADSSSPPETAPEQIASGAETSDEAGS